MLTRVTVSERTQTQMSTRCVIPLAGSRDLGGQTRGVRSQRRGAVKEEAGTRAGGDGEGR